MPRRLIHTALVVLTALAVGLGVSACGGGASDEERAAEHAAQERWEAGVPRWQAKMVGALNQISVMLSNAATVDRLRSGDARTTARLDRHDQTLLGCSATIEQLGVAPGELEHVREQALRTCQALERGARFVHDGVANWQIGSGSAMINRANVALGNGQHGIERVRALLRDALNG
jgi:hypothetical protein